MAEVFEQAREEIRRKLDEILLTMERFIGPEPMTIPQFKEMISRVDSYTNPTQRMALFIVLLYDWIKNDCWLETASDYTTWSSTIYARDLFKIETQQKLLALQHHRHRVDEIRHVEAIIQNTILGYILCSSFVEEVNKLNIFNDPDFCASIRVYYREKLATEKIRSLSSFGIARMFSLCCAEPIDKFGKPCINVTYDESKLEPRLQELVDNMKSSLASI